MSYFDPARLGGAVVGALFDPVGSFEMLTGLFGSEKSLRRRCSFL